MWVAGGKLKYSRTPLSGRWLSGSQIIRIANYPDHLRPSGRFDENLQNQFALKLPVIILSTIQCYGFKNFKSGVAESFRRRFVHTVNCNRRTPICKCSLFSKKNLIIRIFCVSGWLAVSLNSDEWCSTVLWQNLAQYHFVDHRSHIEWPGK